MEQFYTNEESNNKKTPRLKINKLEVISLVIFLIFILLTIAKSFIISDNISYEEYQTRIEKYENKMVSKDASEEYRYIEDYSTKSENESENETLIISFYDDFTYVLKRIYTKDDIQRTYIEGGNVNSEKYNSLIETFNKFANEGIEKEEGLSDLEFLLPNRYIFKIEEGMLLYDNVTEGDRGFEAILNIVKDEEIFEKRKSREVKYE